MGLGGAVIGIAAGLARAQKESSVLQATLCPLNADQVISQIIYGTSGSLRSTVGQAAQKAVKHITGFRNELQAETGEWLRDIKYSNVSFRDELQEETNKWLEE